jgi:phosphoenolpyruvate---glycerone phosphotransferase subunit DhaL
MGQSIITRDDVVHWIQTYAQVIADNRAYLTELDAAIGDADHGANMDRGFKAVQAKLPIVAEKDIATILKTVGMTLLSSVGGAGGPLYATIFLQAGQVAAGKTELTLADWVAMLDAATSGVVNRGKAATGDKTMVDALIPAVQALKDALTVDQPLPEALLSSAQAAERGLQSTLPLVARKGRASYLGERSAGHLDPGAASTSLLIKAAVDTWGKA